jgi:hypothetical protein
LAVVELEAKLSGQIDTSPKNVTINLQTISPEEAVEYAGTELNSLAALPPLERASALRMLFAER